MALNASLYHKDALSFLPSVKDIDLIITDPPYRWNKTTGGRAKNDQFANKWQGNISGSDILKASIPDNDLEYSDWMSLVYGALTNRAHCYIFSNDKNLQDALNAATKVGFRIHNILVWKKNNCTPNRWYMKNLEFIIFLYKGKAFPINNMGANQTLEFSNLSSKIKRHPTEKPVDLLTQLVLNSSKEGAILLDPFMGSGSTGVAALSSNRSFIGIEINQSFFDVASLRLKQYNPTIF